MDKKTSKNKSGTSKKKLIRTRREIIRDRIIAVIIIIAVIATTYFIIDSGTYVATVDGHRISKSEYLFFLNQQISVTENSEGLTTNDEKKEFWTTPSDGQDPFKAAKNKALDFAKEFTIQYLKAKEAGFKIDSDIKSQAASMINTLKGQMTEQQFRDYYYIGSRELQSIYEKSALIDKFKNKYLADEYRAKEYTEDEIKAEYENNKNAYDKVDLSYVTFFKFNDEGAFLTEQEIEAKKKTAEEALEKIKQGESIAKVITQYTEEEAASEDDVVGKETISYNEYSDLIKWAFESEIGAVDIIDTDYVIYVAQVDGRTGYDDVKDNVKSGLESKERENFYESALESWELEPRYNIIMNNRVYDSINYKNFR